VTSTVGYSSGSGTLAVHTRRGVCIRWKRKVVAENDELRVIQIPKLAHQVLYKYKGDSKVLPVLGPLQSFVMMKSVP
jgi:hypothetical protein